MKKIFFLLVFMPVLSGCATLSNLLEPEPQMMASLGCIDAYAVIRDARNRIIVPLLTNQNPEPVAFYGGPGDKVVLIATVISTRTGETLGTVSEDFTIPSKTTRVDGETWRSRDYSKQLNTWEIERLDTQVVPGYSCRRGFGQ
jgi:hypothetical protein